MVDLHVHSTCSDGTFTPTELVEYALTHRISAFALTDHDTTAGLSEAISCAEALSGTVSEKNPEGASVEVIPGIELSSEYNGKDIHIVGLFIDENSKAFKEHVASFLASRENRNHKMCEKLAEYGFDGWQAYNWGTNGYSYNTNVNSNLLSIISTKQQFNIHLYT